MFPNLGKVMKGYLTLLHFIVMRINAGLSSLKSRNCCGMKSLPTSKKNLGIWHIQTRVDVISLSSPIEKCKTVKTLHIYHIFVLCKSWTIRQATLINQHKNIRQITNKTAYHHKIRNNREHTMLALKQLPNFNLRKTEYIFYHIPMLLLQDSTNQICTISGLLLVLLQ